MGGAYLRPDEVPRGDQTPAGRFAIARWGGPTTYATRSVTVGTTPSRVLVNDATRFKSLFLNLGSSDVFAGFDSKVSTTNGFKVVSSTGTLEINAQDDGEEVIGELWMVSGTAGQTVMILEVTRV